MRVNSKFEHSKSKQKKVIDKKLICIIFWDIVYILDTKHGHINLIATILESNLLIYLASKMSRLTDDERINIIEFIDSIDGQYFINIIDGQ